MKLLQACTLAAALAGLTSAHMHLTSPIPLDHADPDNNRPLEADGSDFPCKGLVHTAKDFNASLTWTAGEKARFSIKGGAIHGGGSCQASLSVDGGETFKVVHSWLGNCPKTIEEHEFEFRVPFDTPDTKNAVFSWSWLNRWGNREFYQDCAAVDIRGREGRGGKGAGHKYDELEHKSSSYGEEEEEEENNPEHGSEYEHKFSSHGKEAEKEMADKEKSYSNVEGESYPDISFHERPHIFVANLEGISSCKTIEGKPVKFPHPGPDVTSDGEETADPAGECHGPGPAPAFGGRSGGESRHTSVEAPAPTKNYEQPEHTSVLNDSWGSSTRSHAAHATIKPGNASGHGQDYRPGNDWPKDFVHVSESGDKLSAVSFVSGLALLFVVLL